MVLAGDIAAAGHRVRRRGGDCGPIGRLHPIVNNAGMCDDGPIEDESLEESTRVIQTDLVAADLCPLMAPLLFMSDGATVINVASIFGRVASRSPMAAYNASKGALVNLTRHLAAQWGVRGGNVRTHSPPGTFRQSSYGRAPLTPASSRASKPGRCWDGYQRSTRLHGPPLAPAIGCV